LKSDREKWEKRYWEGDPGHLEPDRFLADYKDLLTSGRALDVAAGYGGNAVFAAELGYSVDAVDISFNALTFLRRRAGSLNLDIRCCVADLDYFPIPEHRYDLVTVFYFHSPTLITSIKQSLKIDGLIVYATFNFRHTSLKPGFNADYLVPPGGLAPYFEQFDIIVDEPEGGDDRNISRIIARKRACSSG
jgi:tellurite methyltransferase